MKGIGFIIIAFSLTAALGAQQKKTAAAVAAAATGVASLCDDPYQVGRATDGWPEAPVYILFHREKSKAPWARNPAIHVPNVEAASAATARTLVCVEESRIPMGHYDSGEPAYTPSWDITLIRLSDRKVYFLRTGFYGKEPPGIKFHRGAGVGAPPTEIFADWLPLVVSQKVARFKLRLRSKEFHEASALAFSADSSKLVLAQEPRSTLDGTPPTPITVFDLAAAKAVNAWHTDYIVRELAISSSGNMVATGRYGHPEIWDVATGRLLHKLDTNAPGSFGAESLLFGPNDVLGATNNGKATLWDVNNEHVVSSAAGSRVVLSPAGEWLVVRAEAKAVAVQALQSGNALASFRGVSKEDKYAVSGDLKSMIWEHGYAITIVAAGTAEEHSVSLPYLGFSLPSAFAPTRDGIVFANGEGFVGLASATNLQPRVFVTDQSGIRALAVSPDGKLLAVGDSSGVVTIWELLSLP